MIKQHSALVRFIKKIKYNELDDLAHDEDKDAEITLIC